MSEEGVERRLTTILAADVLGCSRLMAADEAGTVVALRSHPIASMMFDPRLMWDAVEKKDD